MVDWLNTAAIVPGIGEDVISAGVMLCWEVSYGIISPSMKRNLCVRERPTWTCGKTVAETEEIGAMMLD